MPINYQHLLKTRKCLKSLKNDLKFDFVTVLKSLEIKLNKSRLDVKY